MSAPQEIELADTIASITLSVAGVSALHPGEFGEIATYLPGRRIVGIRNDAEVCEIHISVEYPSDVHEVARGVRDAVGPHVSVPIVVTVEDVAIQPTGSHR
ncbi:hypothetical protein E5720_14535 [Rhodococcus sp. PAMC28707]|uniref:hypothetical protein n=1 Tax=unclassified Rhodococcus (in: high G+C Gram-positive bacteria) TaxID=192944 RepID=UPI00109E0D8A|nr:MULTISPECIES: hypothetical protein [unclassified Rhodococcus (in: high G+C Gram-positive bacteria)]QCB52304.1 hypothetical protein E5769_20985 [Rhodococcus sp. PAMC28705]QCB59526.1 hypothetical protein E5720_14535 [Rhodococcus sp. PAMC28707]